jgi:Flp pilus assembly pilin Flp
MNGWREAAATFIHEEDGASTVEYSILAALIIGVCIVIIAIFGNQVRGAFQNFYDLFMSVIS